MKEEQSCASEGAELIDESSLVQCVEAFLGDAIAPLKWLDGGDEAVVLLAASRIGSLVVHASPSWRTQAELEWVHHVVRHVRESVSETVAPIERGGKTTFEWDRRQIAVYPFIAGDFLNRDDPVLRKNAACLLAAIHRSLLDFSGEIRPENKAGKPSGLENSISVRDSKLDAWWESVRVSSFKTGPTHGDYYRRNLLCTDHRIVGVIDWHDASVRPLALELAQATFEICRNKDHTLQLNRANEFVAHYLAADGPIPFREVEFLVPLMRIWIREDIRSSLADGSDMSGDYVANQVRAFRDLANCDWAPV